MRLSKKLVNLHAVADSICSVGFSSGVFAAQFFDENKCAVLSSRRDGIGKAVIEMIPDNWTYRIIFEDGVVFLHIWI